MAGKTRRVYVRRRDLIRAHGLQPRDLRRVDPSLRWVGSGTAGQPLLPPEAAPPLASSRQQCGSPGQPASFDAGSTCSGASMACLPA